MDKLKMQTANKADENFKKLAAMFPNAITETIDENGEVVRAIDKDVLMQEISCKVVDGNEERYQFTWPDKKKSVLLANAPINKTLRPCREESVDFDNTENLYIEGDNLEVLKLLQETYLGKVKMIYIDPPYNTGNDFVYADDFAQSTDEYLENSGQFDDEGNRLVKNLDTNGRFHSDWLNMIYPRLKLAKDLLTEDGVIFISIDGHELETLEFLCNEVFSKSNFLGTIVLQTATDNNPTQINEEHEYMVCYAKNRSCLLPWYRISEAAEAIQKQYEKIKRTETNVENIQTKLREWINNNKDKLSQVAHYNCVDEKGVYSASSNSSNPHPGGYMYDILHYKTKLPCPKPANGWRWPEKTFLKWEKDGEVHWGADHTTQPHIKKRLSTAREQLKSMVYEDNRAETKMLSQLFDGKKVFDNPKPHKVLARVIDFATNEGDIVLDFFSGSSSTAHAVIKLNVDDNGNRKFIMVQLPEETDEKSEAYKAGYKNICEIGKERIRRAAKKIAEENPEAQFDGGFRVLKCDSSNMKEVYYNPAEYEPSLFSRLEDNIKEDRTPEDLLFQVMLDLGVLLSSKIEETTIAGKKVFNVEDNNLIACFDDNVTEEVIAEIAKQKPYYFVMRDSSMANDSVATNFEQIFAAYSPDTVRKVL